MNRRRYRRAGACGWADVRAEVIPLEGGQPRPARAGGRPCFSRCGGAWRSIQVPGKLIRTRPGWDPAHEYRLHPLPPPHYRMGHSPEFASRHYSDYLTVEVH
jgi:hypothetical protein